MRTRTASWIKDAKTDQITSLAVDYSVEHDEDLEFARIKKLCFSYLDGIDTNVDIEEIIYMGDFLEEKYDYVLQMKNSMGLINFSYPITEISKLIDTITLSDELNGLSGKNNYLLLTKEINYLMESIGLCYGILDKMIEDKIQDDL